MQKKLHVTKTDAHVRLDRFLAGHFSDYSRTRIKQYIAAQQILLNGKKTKASQTIRENDIISVDVPQELEIPNTPFFLPLDIIYEDNDIIIINKPAGIVVHPANPRRPESIVNALLTAGKELAPSSTLRPGVVHRLDKETTGVMILAKNNPAYYALISQFAERKIKKEYRAIAWGEIPRDTLLVDLPLQRDTRNRLKMKIGFTGAKDARTRIQVLQRMADATYIALDLLTGRMHQIRVHLKFLNAPIVGDKKYGKKDGYSNLYLHAYRLGFLHPQSKKFVEFVAPLPSYFETFIKERKHAHHISS